MSHAQSCLAESNRKEKVRLRRLGSAPADQQTQEENPSSDRTARGDMLRTHRISMGTASRCAVANPQSAPRRSLACFVCPVGRQRRKQAPLRFRQSDFLRVILIGEIRLAQSLRRRQFRFDSESLLQVLWMLDGELSCAPRSTRDGRWSRDTYC